MSLEKITKRSLKTGKSEKRAIKQSDCISIDKDSPSVKSYKINTSDLKGNLYITKGKSNPPDWIDMCENLTSGEDLKKSYKRHSISAVAIVKLKGSKRYFILTFGHGHQYVKESSVEKNFGRNVILNTVDADNFKALRSLSYDNTPWHKETQATIASNLALFEYNGDYELLKRVTAEFNENIPKKFFKEKRSKENLVSSSVTGHESLSLSSKIGIDEFPDFFKWIEGQYKRKQYKKLIPNIDAFEEIKDLERINKLNNSLIKQIQKRHKRLNVIIPDFIDMEKVDAYSINDLEKSDELSSDEVLLYLQNKEKITIDILKSNHIKVYSGDTIQDKWTIYKCITTEVIIGSSTYALITNNWYKIDKDFYSKMTTNLNSYLVQKKTHSNYCDLKKFNKSIHNNEAGYNSDHLNINDQKYVLDQKFVYFNKGTNKIELCDILFKNQLIHVKRFGSTTGISHLNFQSIISAQVIKEFPKEVEKLIKKEINNSTHEDYIISKLKEFDFTIHLAIICENNSYDKSKKIKNFSIFNLISLSKTIEELNKTIGPGKCFIQLIECTN
ncbi:DUF6119 family protein [Halobacteriovorax sp. FRX-2]